jgi:hypothetical protein
MMKLTKQLPLPVPQPLPTYTIEGLTAHDVYVLKSVTNFSHIVGSRVRDEIANYSKTIIGSDLTVMEMQDVLARLWSILPNVSR